MPDPRPIFWTDVTSGMRGYFAVLLSKRGADIDVEQSGIGSYATREGAEQEARDWAASEEIPYGSPLDNPINYDHF